MRDRLIVATHNAHKTAEIREMVGSHFAEIVDLTGNDGVPVPEEDGDTFEANSTIKAMSASPHFPGALILADDSGIEVDALGGAPGVISAIYAGPEADDSANRAKLLRELERAGAHEPELRTGRFRCVLTLVGDGVVRARFDGVCEGRILDEERGEGGFGYDSLFVPEGYDRSFGELDAGIKHRISHRARAIAAFREWLETCGG